LISRSGRWRAASTENGAVIADGFADDDDGDASVLLDDVVDDPFDDDDDGDEDGDEDDERFGISRLRLLLLDSTLSDDGVEVGIRDRDDAVAVGLAVSRTGVDDD
jgi:hypothetical protein